MSGVLLAFSKECGFTAFYAKGHGDSFHDYVETHHPGRGILPPVRVQGNRQDEVGLGALNLFSILDIVVEWLDYRLTCGELSLLIIYTLTDKLTCILPSIHVGNSDNILQRCLFITFESTEMIAVIRLLAIWHLTIDLPMRWVAAKCHELKDWSERDMGLLFDLLDEAMLKIQLDGEKMLDEDTMMNIFHDVKEKLPDLAEFLDNYYYNKKSLVAGSRKKEDSKCVIEEVISELFTPTKDEVRETHDTCCMLATKMATRCRLELRDTSKAAHHYFSATKGKHSVAEVSEVERQACMNMKANNSDAESFWGTLTCAMEGSGMISLDHAAGEGQTRSNGDFSREHELQNLVTGRKSKKESDKSPSIGTFHTLPLELKQSLIATAKKFAKRGRRRYQAALKRQRQYKERIEKLAMDKKIDLLQADYIGATYLWLQGHSDRLWDTVEKANREYNRLKSETAKLRAVKEQILIRYVGFGWSEAHHPWSRGEITYNSKFLFTFLTDVVIPMAETETVPDHPPMNLPTRPTMAKLGTQSGKVAKMDSDRVTGNSELRRKWIEKREELESEGKGDILMEIQRSSMPDFNNESLKGFKIDMLFSYENGVVEWCQGVIEKVVNAKYRTVKVRWEDKCLREGERKVTTEKLAVTKWNPSGTQTKGAWREDLRDALDTLLAKELLNT